MAFHNMDVIIPVYQPNDALLKLIPKLLTLNLDHIIIVDDGSDDSKKTIFEQLATLPQVIVLHHVKNLGKGAALKTGMTWVLQHCPNTVGIVTVDADGQHLSKDIKMVAAELQRYPNDFVLGVRAFDTKVPLRSRFGNSLTRTLFRWRYRVKIQDTQTGLRGIPLWLVKAFVRIPAGRYEFEMACLIFAVRNKVVIKQVSTDTVYVDHNISSHFKPIIDSIRIYSLFLRMALSFGKKTSSGKR